jgi:hypothetical protein
MNLQKFHENCRCFKVKLELYLYLNVQFVWLKDKLELYLYLNVKLDV